MLTYDSINLILLLQSNLNRKKNSNSTYIFTVSCWNWYGRKSKHILDCLQIREYILPVSFEYERTISVYCFVTVTHGYSEQADTEIMLTAKLF